MDFSVTPPSPPAEDWQHQPYDPGEHNGVSQKNPIGNLYLQVDNDERARRSLRAIKKDFRALGQLAKGSGAQIVFSSVPPVLGTDDWINKKIRQINAWLCNWCYQQGFGFTDHSLIYRTPGLLEYDGKALSRKGKRVLGQELAKLMDRALN
ncbi:hypothetical protein llap_7114 [Limosa lapponica baueri]|uniref:Rna-directed dna polymerase from mobile element jockey-like n=1 Tax=Limosa lapponica baueri TaxID=1758121 RepID=A0A2I0U9E3_LIMLA|nr:hypothetical protein llap_7114 [Limosa lapponica baueri]